MNTIPQLAEIVADIQAHLNTAEVIGFGVQQFRLPVPAIQCRDGVEFSIQASNMTYCVPRNNTGPWTHVEVMTVTPGAQARNWEQGEDSIGAYVPIEAVAKEIYERGYTGLTK